MAYGSFLECGKQRVAIKCRPQVSVLFFTNMSFISSLWELRLPEYILFILFILKRITPEGCLCAWACGCSSWASFNRWSVPTRS